MEVRGLFLRVWDWSCDRLILRRRHEAGISRSGFCAGSQARHGVGAHGFPSQFLEEVVEFFLIRLTHVGERFESGRPGQSNGAAAIDDGEVAVAGEHLQWREGVAPGIAEEGPLVLEARGFSGGDFFPQGTGGESDGNDDHRVFPGALIDSADEVLDVFRIAGVVRPELGEVSGVVIGRFFGLERATLPVFGPR